VTGKKGGGGSVLPPLSEEESNLFRATVGDARPLPDTGKAHFPTHRPRPIPQQTLLDERQVLADSLSDHIPWELAETGEELSYLRAGMAPLTLRKLRRGHWVIQAELDLHGMTRDIARACLADFLNQCRKRGLRCVRIIHGKGLGSRNREPVLKRKVASWLMQRDEVLAFCQARPADGGSGAAIVLLKSG
jgi:DNA-nicking Smr family endonuclease